MDFSLREWLILVGVVIIIAILVDGYRRYRKNQQALQGEGERDDDDFVDPEQSLKEAMVRRELPNGGARPVSSSVDGPDPIANAFENARKTSSAPLKEMPHKVDAGPQIQRDDDIRLDELESLVPERLDASSANGPSVDQDYSEPTTQTLDEEYDNVLLDPTSDLNEESDSHQEDYEHEEDYERSYSSVDVDQVTPQGELQELEDEQDDEAEIEEVIVINVFAPEDNPFAGMELLQLVINCGMRYGEMDIFHRHEEGFDRGRVQFSMANAIEPGTFDLDTMGESTSPGVSFFMGLPGPKNSMKAFDFMLETSQTLVRNLGGELRDERRSPMSEQTIAHCRQRIRDFERRKLTRQKKS